MSPEQSPDDQQANLAGYIYIYILCVLVATTSQFKALDGHGLSLVFDEDGLACRAAGSGPLREGSVRGRVWPRGRHPHLLCGTSFEVRIGIHIPPFMSLLLMPPMSLLLFLYSFFLAI